VASAIASRTIWSPAILSLPFSAWSQWCVAVRIATRNVPPNEPIVLPATPTNVPAIQGISRLNRNLPRGDHAPELGAPESGARDRRSRTIRRLDRASLARRLAPALATGLLVAASLGPLAPAVNAAVVVAGAADGSAISADSAANGSGPAYTTLTGPSFAVTHPGGIGVGAITFGAPAGFTFDTTSTPAIAVGGTGLIGSCSTPATTTITCTVTTPSSVDGTVTVSGIAVRPTAATPLASGSIALGGSAGLTGSAGSLAEVAGTPTKLTFATPPGGGPAWAAFATQPVVTVTDAAGNTATGSAASVTLAIGTNPSGGTLTCSGSGAGGLTVTAVGGVATFTGCSINKTGTGYTLVASSSGLTSATSSPFTVSPGQNGLVFVIQPGGGPAGTAFATQPTVQVQDPGGNLVTTSTATVTLTLTSNPGGGTLTCTPSLSKAAVGGVVSFAGCRIDKPGTGYAVTATATGMTGGTSAPFNVVPGPPAVIVFTTQPAGGAAGVPFDTQPVVTVQDSVGNTVTASTASVTLAILSGTGTAGAVLSCAGGTTVAAVAGVATFAGCSVSKAGTGFKLVATTAGLPAATSAAFAMSPAPPAGLSVTSQPSASAGSNTAFAVQPSVSVTDMFGQTVTSSALAVTLSITPGTGTPGAALSCTGGTTKAASSGVATFSGCKIDLLGSGYTFTATAAGVTPAITNAIAITAGPAVKLAFTTQPVGGVYGTLFAAQPAVTVQDTNGNTVATSAATVTLAIAAGTGTTGAALACAGGQTRSAVAGVALFTGCSINKIGTGYRLTATAASLTPAGSNPFDTTVGPPSQLVVLTQPVGSGVAAPFSSQPVIAIRDAGGNTVAASSSAVSVAITPGSGTSGAVLTCSGGTTVPAVAGTVAFNGCAIDRAGAGYTLTFTATGVTSVASAAFSIAAGAPVKMVFTTQPSTSAVHGTAFAQQPVVDIQDVSGNRVITSTASATIALTAGTGTVGAKLACSGGLSKAAVAGVVSLAGCLIDKAGTGYTLTISSGTLTAAVSSSIAIAAGPPSKLAFTTAPSTTAASGAAFAVQPVVAIQDAAGNTVATSTATVTLSIASGTGMSGAAIGCTGGVSKAAVAGVATFAGCAIDKAGTAYLISADATGLSGVKTAAIAVTVGAPAKLGFTVDPVGAVGGTALAKQPSVAMQDASGSTVPTATTVVTLAIASGTGTSGAVLTCTGGLGRAGTGGVAAFPGCTIDKAGTGYRLTATAPGLTSATSVAFDISQGPAKQLGFTSQPVGGSGGLPFSTQPVVAVQDFGGSTAGTSTASVTLAITSSTGTSGAVLTCDGGLTKAAVNGVVTFSGCTIDRAGTGYTLAATSSSLTQAVSKAFTMTTPVARMTVTPATPAIRYGQAASLTIAFGYGGANATVNLEESLDGTTWYLVSPVTTDATGQAQFLYLISTSRWFRVRYDGDPSLLPGTSPVVRVLVRSSTIIRPTNGSKTKTVRRGTSVAFTAYVRPTYSTTPRTVVTFEVYRLVGKSWAFVTQRTARTNSLGRATLHWTLSATGHWSIRARAAGTPQNATSPWSGLEMFNVI
jgi:hypothetical protein